MKIGVNILNFGPGTDPGILRSWAQTVEGLGFDLLMLSDHVAITPDVETRHPQSALLALATVAAHRYPPRTGTETS